jgi:hypothetical protein
MASNRDEDKILGMIDAQKRAQERHEERVKNRDRDQSEETKEADGSVSLTPGGSGDFMNFFRKCTVTLASPINCTRPSTPTTNNETKPRDPAAIFLDSPQHGMTTEQRQAFRDIVMAAQLKAQQTKD